MNFDQIGPSVPPLAKIVHMFERLARPTSRLGEPTFYPERPDIVAELQRLAAPLRGRLEDHALSGDMPA